MLKKIGFLALATGLTAMTLAGCGTNSGSPANKAGQAVGNASTSTKTTIELYANGDTNVQALWDKVIIPGFEKQYPDIIVHDNFLQHGNGSQAVMAKLQAASKTNKKSVNIDLVEGDPGTVVQGQADNVWQKITTSDVSNLATVQSGLLQPVSGQAIPYRGSSVVLAYNSNKVKNPPQTYDGLIKWIKTHKGQFAYNDPSTGGAGQAFVISAVYNFMKPSDFPAGYDKSIESKWNKGFAMLKSLAPDLYQNGVYPKGNQGTLDLLAKGDIAMAPVWSDMALSELKKGTLPANIKLMQITPGFTGGGAYVLVPKLSAHKKADYTFLNYLLTPAVQAEIVKQMNGYPAVSWNLLPSDLQKEFSGIAKDYRYWPGQYSSDLNKLWQQRVAN